MSKRGDDFTPAQAAAIAERHDNGGGELGGVGNLLRLVRENVGDEIKAKRTERDGLVAKVRALNLELADLETHQQVGGEPATTEGT